MSTLAFLTTLAFLVGLGAGEIFDDSIEFDDISFGGSHERFGSRSGSFELGRRLGGGISHLGLSHGGGIKGGGIGLGHSDIFIDGGHVGGGYTGGHGGGYGGGIIHGGYGGHGGGYGIGSGHHGGLYGGHTGGLKYGTNRGGYKGGSNHGLYPNEYVTGISSAYLVDSYYDVDYGYGAAKGFPLSSLGGGFSTLSHLGGGKYGVIGYGNGGHGHGVHGGYHTPLYGGSHGSSGFGGGHVSSGYGGGIGTGYGSGYIKK